MIITKHGLFCVYFAIISAALAALPWIWWGAKISVLSAAGIGGIVAIQYFLHTFLYPANKRADFSTVTPRGMFWIVSIFLITLFYMKFYRLYLASDSPSDWGFISRS